MKKNSFNRNKKKKKIRNIKKKKAGWEAFDRIIKTIEVVFIGGLTLALTYNAHILTTTNNEIVNAFSERELKIKELEYEQKEEEKNMRKKKKLSQEFRD